MHFQTWQDKAGNAPALTDPTNGLVFPDLNKRGEDSKPNRIMPEPTVFLDRKLASCSILRPTETVGAAVGAVKGLAASGLFTGQSQEFFDGRDSARKGRGRRNPELAPELPATAVRRWPAPLHPRVAGIAPVPRTGSRGRRRSARGTTVTWRCTGSA